MNIDENKSWRMKIDISSPQVSPSCMPDENGLISGTFRVRDIENEDPNVIYEVELSTINLQIADDFAYKQYLYTVKNTASTSTTQVTKLNQSELIVEKDFKFSIDTNGFDLGDGFVSAFAFYIDGKVYRRDASQESNEKTMVYELDRKKCGFVYIKPRQ